MGCESFSKAVKPGRAAAMPDEMAETSSVRIKYPQGTKNTGISSCVLNPERVAVQGGAPRITSALREKPEGENQEASGRSEDFDPRAEFYPVGDLCQGKTPNKL
jgi:hypothetical protein